MAKIFLSTVIIHFLFFPTPAQAATIQPVSTSVFTSKVKSADTLEVSISAAIGEPKLTLFGWTSPKALVELSGQRVGEQVISNEEGYFLFDRVFLPRPTIHLTGGHSPTSEVNSFYPELCLSSIDTQSRISFPTCLPPLPDGPFNIQVGPVLLPPSLSLSKGLFRPGEESVALGATIPNTPVSVFLANDRPSGKIIRQASAYFLPQYQIISDKNGQFEFNLPNSKTGLLGQSTQWRVFASAEFQGSPTPKGNTLSFKILSPWDWFWLQLGLLWGLILIFTRPYLWFLIVVLELIILGKLLAKNQPQPLGQNLASDSGLQKVLRRLR